MSITRTIRRRHVRHAALLAVASAALLAAAACTGATADVAASHLGTSPSASASASSPTTAAAPVLATTPGTSPASAAPVTVPASAGAAKSPVPACGNDDLALGLGYGTQSLPLQAGSVVITNVSDHTCTLLGYPGAAIVVDGTTVNATRVLNGYRGDLPKLTAPPLVTLAPGASSYSVLEWIVGNGPNCYPTGDGKLEVTAPGTTLTRVLSSAMLMGRTRICSGFEVNPVVAGYFGIPVGVPARN